MAPDVRQDDQIEFQGRLDHDDQNSTKQSLITSYKKNLYPALKAEIHTSLSDPNLSKSGRLSSRSKFYLSNLRDLFECCYPMQCSPKLIRKATKHILFWVLLFLHSLY